MDVAMDDDVGSSEPTPLVISPIFQYGDGDRAKKEGTNAGRYRTIQRLVTATPNPLLKDVTLGEVETTLEEYVTPNGDCLWTRVAVRSGLGSGDGPERMMHASFTLPTSGQQRQANSDKTAMYGTSPGESILCWAAFPDRPNRKLLCVLASPSLLCIWDVYPSQEESADCSGEEGHSVTLPFEARAIYPLGERHGLLLQRVDTMDDQYLCESMRDSLWGGGHVASEDEEDGFVLAAPPRPLRLGTVLTSPSTAGSSLDIPVVHPSSQLPSIPSAIPSLFSLRHALDEVLPVAMLPRDADQASSLVSDVYEKLLFVGTSRWTDHDNDTQQKREYSQPICVTYHTRLKRHAVWTLQSAPPPPPTPPLWQISRSQRTENSSGAGWNSHLGEVEHAPHIANDGDLAIVGAADVEGTYDGNVPPANRNEALADALGVRTTKKADDMVSNRGRRGRGRSRRSGSFSGLPTSLLTPPPVTTAARTLQMDVEKEASRRKDPSPRGSDGTPRNAAGLTVDTSMPSSPFSTLHPEVSVKLLYEEDASLLDACYSEASSVFLASNAKGSGTLLLCLLCPVRNKPHPFVLRCFSLHAERCDQESGSGPDGSLECIENRSHDFSLTELSSISCRSAQPIQAIPIAPSFRPHQGNGRRDSLNEPLATDILILSSNEPVGREDGGTAVSVGLYRTSLKVADCVLKAQVFEEKTQNCRVVGLGNAVLDRMDFICEADSGEAFLVRGMLSLVLSSSSVAERALAAVESVLMTVGVSTAGTRLSPFAAETELALKVRADCARLLQSLSAWSDGDLLLQEDPAWSAVSTVLSHVIDSVLLGVGQEEVDYATNERETQMITGAHRIDDDAAWATLLHSEYHQNYIAEHGASLFLGFQNDILPNASMPHEAKSSMQSIEQQLLGVLSSIHSYSVDCLKRATCLVETTDSGSLGSSARHIFESLHLLYEDSKLSRTSRSSAWLRSIGSILVRACARVNQIALREETEDKKGQTVMGDFLDHYRRDLGDDWLERVETSIGVLPLSLPFRFEPDNYRQAITSFSHPPCFLSWVEGAIRGLSRKKNKSYTSRDVSYDWGPAQFNAACGATCSLHRIFSILFCTNDQDTGVSGAKTSAQQERDMSVVSAMIEEGMKDSAELRDELPVGLALPLMETLHRCRGDPQSASGTSWHCAAWSLIGRADLGQHFNHLSDPCADKCARSLPVLQSLETGHQLFVDRDKDGIVPIEVSSSMLFPDDNRVHEAGRLLRSSRPSYLRVPRAIEVSDHDYERLKQERLLILCYRILSLPLGRGMLTLGSLQPVAAEPLPIPDIYLSGRVPPTNATLALDVSNCPPDMKVWPEFHNGVAAGLRLPDAGDGQKSTITRTWIVYNRPPQSDAHPPSNNGNVAAEPSAPQADHSHGGLLMALGLRGHLSALSMTDIYDYLTQGTVTTTVGILIGMAANKMGTCDPSVSKMLCLHIPSLLPPSFAAIDVAGPAQAAAVAGIGLLYQRSSHRLMTEFLLNEMGKRPVNDMSICDREAYTLSCGLALGMVNLCRGHQADGSVQEGGGSAGLADLHIEERLHRYIVGGIDDLELRRRRESADRASSTSGGTSGEQERCSRIFEGDTINTDVTAPGATLALGLMYLRSGNKTIASSLSLPDTHFLLEYVRPDLLLMRVIARALILWDDIDPTSDWIEDQIPGVVGKSYIRMQATAEKATAFGPMSIEVSSVNDDIEQEGQSARNNGTSPSEKKADNASFEGEVDRQAIRQIHAHVVAGACFAIGLRFAGTGDDRAASAISERVMHFLTLRDENDPISVALRPEQQILEMCLGCSAIALAMVMAGTGDLDTLRLFKALRWRCDGDVKYGSHVAFGAAIGLLFLGSGSCTLGRAPEDIAALLMAFFPRFPSSTSDNKYHLQALRHCYALAVKHRELHAVDVDTREEVFVPIEIEMEERPNEPVRLTAPCLLLNTNERPMQLRVVSERYYPLSLNASGHELFKSGGTLFVKKRSGHLSYFQDPHAQRSLLVQTGSSSGHSALELIRSFTEDPRILAYAKYLCENGTTRKSSRTGRTGFSVSDFCTTLLHECLAGDKEDVLPLYLSLRSAAESMETESSTAIRTTWDIRLIRTYYEEHHRLIEGYSDISRLLSPDFVASLSETVDRFLLSMGLDDSALVSYVNSYGRWSPLSGNKDFFGSFLTWYDVPFPVDLAGTADLNDKMDMS